MSRYADRYPDDVLLVRSPALVAELIAKGCRLVKRVKGGALFHATGTVRQIISEYAQRSYQRRARLDP